MKKHIHLICNAHLDPVWLWEWQEGAAEAISTFRTAVELCERHEGFVFNHNEVILYEWVREYEPALFERIREQVRAGRWHIMGGWYLQPDCTMPSGESFVRQILAGRTYFQQHFGARPTTAINFDPFGHSRGLVQILAKSGFDSYLFGRPGPAFVELDNELFVWVGFDGSEVLAKRFRGWYNTHLGQARQQVEERIEGAAEDAAEILWGVGNHGGGPSRRDLADLEAMIAEREDMEIVHSTPEAYFADARKRGVAAGRREADLNPWAIGCYTSMARIKQKHRQLESELYLVEKMASAAGISGLMEYPAADLEAAGRDLMFGQFHDILPGSAIAAVEEAAARTMDHGLEILSRVKARAFFALAAGQKPAREGEVPILIYNPHPHRIEGVFECEFNLPDFNYSGTFTDVTVRRGKRALPSQVEKEQSNFPLDWRKRVVFRATLEPGQMNRFDCQLRALEAKPAAEARIRNGRLVFETAELRVVINARTGLVDQYRAGGVEYVGTGAFCPVVLEDSVDAWEMRRVRYGRTVGKFKLLDRAAGAKFSGLEGTALESVRVIEDGAVRTVVEAVFGFEESFVCQHYILPKQGTEVGVVTRVYWNQKNRLLKLRVPLAAGAWRYWGQTAFGTQELPASGDEAVAQKWTAATDEAGRCLSCINDGTYGSDLAKGVMRLTLLRSPAYSGHPVKELPILPTDRFVSRIDQGERVFGFWFNGGEARERLERVGGEAMAKHERPYALSFYPGGAGRVPEALAAVNAAAVEMTAFKRAQDGDGWIVRLFNSGARRRRAAVKLAALGVEQQVELGAQEVKTLRVDRRGRVSEVNLVEEG